MTDWKTSLGGSLSAISLSPDGQKVVAGGRDVLRVLSLGANSFVPVENLRMGATKNLNLTTNDAQWHPTEDHLIVTAATNGAIAIWNLNISKTSKQERVLSQHTRTVNRVAWHRVDPNLLLSGSQDGTVKLWDLRMEGTNSVSTFMGKSESVRDISFSPFYPMYYLAAFENGTVQIVDHRKPEKYYRRVTAHQGNVLTIAWHPSDKNQFASAGRDRTIKLWKLPHTNRPTRTIHTIASVSRLAWRPNHPTHIASANNIIDFRIHLWDFDSPHIPLASFTGHQDVPTGITWCPRDPEHHILSCSKDTNLMRHALSNAHKPYKHINSVSLSWTVDSEIASAARVIDRDRLRTDDAGKADMVEPVPVTVTALYDPRGDSLLGFDKVSFIHLATHYRSAVYAGEDPGIVCEYNAGIAADIGRNDLASMWRLLSAMFYPDSAFGANSSTLSQPAVAAGASGAANNVQGTVVIGMPPGPGTVPTPGVGGTNTASDVNLGSETEALSEVTSGLPAAVEIGAPGVVSVSDTTISLRHPQFISGQGSLASGSVQSSVDYNSAKGALHPTVVTDTLPGAAVSGGSLPTVAPTASATGLPEGSLFDPEFSESKLISATPESAWFQENLLGPEAFPSAMFNLPNIDDTLGGNKGTKAMADLTIQLPPMPEWDPTPHLHNVLEYHANLGDVQTCVFVSLIFRSHLQSKEHDLRLANWLTCYIDLLHRLQCFGLATEMLKTAPDVSPNLTNAKSTTIYTSCPWCQKPLLESSLECYRCKKPVNPCSICHQAVKGLYVWCQGCGHGGHLDHMRDWFASYSQCPTGCLHKCALVTPSITQSTPSLSTTAPQSGSSGTPGRSLRGNGVGSTGVSVATASR